MVDLKVTYLLMSLPDTTGNTLKGLIDKHVDKKESIEWMVGYRKTERRISARYH